MPRRDRSLSLCTEHPPRIDSCGCRVGDDSIERDRIAVDIGDQRQPHSNQYASSDWSHQNGQVSPDERYPDLLPPDEWVALTQRLDHYRSIARAGLDDLEWGAASRRLFPATDLTIAGIVKHLSWAEDRWFQGRLRDNPMPPPWDSPGADDPDAAMRFATDDTVDGIVALYDAACSRSRAATGICGSLSRVAAVPSFGRGPVNAHWILLHMIDETGRHAGHLDLLRDHLHCI